MARRRIMLAATALVMAIVVATGVSGAFAAGGKKSPKNAAAAGQRLSGTWLSTVTLQNPPPGVAGTFLALDTFTRSGEVLVSSAQAQPSTRSLAQGDWVRTGNHQFASTFVWFRFDSTGQWTGMQRVRRTMTLAPSLDAFTSEDVIEVLTPNGTVVAMLHGTEAAERLSP